MVRTPVRRTRGRKTGRMVGRVVGVRTGGTEGDGSLIPHSVSPVFLVPPHLGRTWSTGVRVPDVDEEGPLTVSLESPESRTLGTRHGREVELTV